MDNVLSKPQPTLIDHDNMSRRKLLNQLPCRLRHVIGQGWAPVSTMEVRGKHGNSALFTDRSRASTATAPCVPQHPPPHQSSTVQPRKRYKLSTTTMVRKRQTGASEPSRPAPESSIPSMPAATSPSGGAWSLRTQWMFFAVASGACAAFNGVFAKL